MLVEVKDEGGEVRRFPSNVRDGSPNHLVDEQSLVHWTDSGKGPEQSVFHEGTRQPTNIIHLIDGNMSLTKQVELETHILDFYEELYTRDEQVEGDTEART